jgi:hypothetical protein
MLADRCQGEEEGMVANPEEEALTALRAYQESVGMTFENPDEPVAGDGKWGPEGDLPWR